MFRPPSSGPSWLIIAFSAAAGGYLGNALWIRERYGASVLDSLKPDTFINPDQSDAACQLAARALLASMTRIDPTNPVANAAMVERYSEEVRRACS